VITLYESDTLKVCTSETGDEYNTVEYLHIYENGKEVTKISATAETVFKNFEEVPYVEFDSAG
jgi:hypothetical protein